MPPLLLMQFCERGSLESYLHAFVEDMTVARLDREAQVRALNQHVQQTSYL
jgi:hypothetical protein